MDRRQVLAGMAAMGVVGSLNPSVLFHAQSPEPQTSEPQSSGPSPGFAHAYDPERRELLGPVKMCIEDDAVGFVTTREYGPDRKLLRIRTEHDGRILYDSLDDPSSEKRDAKGRMLSHRTHGWDGEMQQVSYNYDAAGTLRSITNDRNSDRTEFREVNGVKMSIQTFDPKVLRMVRMGFQSWEGVVLGVGVPKGGSAITTYDERGNPIELRILSADGQIFRQVVRKYDASGRLEEEKTLQQNDDWLFLDRMPPEQIAALTPEQAQAMAQELKEAMYGKLPPGIRYKYDAQGRVIEKRERNIFEEQTTTIDYNDRGDIARKRETFTDNTLNVQGNHQPSEDREIRYSHKYDRFNNWTEKVITYDSGSNSSTLTTRRTITYYWSAPLPHAKADMADTRPHLFGRRLKCAEKTNLG
jgi:YD repeat-containing protein